MSNGFYEKMYSGIEDLPIGIMSMVCGLIALTSDIWNFDPENRFIIILISIFLILWGAHLGLKHITNIIFISSSYILKSFAK